MFLIVMSDKAIVLTFKSEISYSCRRLMYGIVVIISSIICTHY